MSMKPRISGDERNRIIAESLNKSLPPPWSGYLQGLADDCERADILYGTIELVRDTITEALPKLENAAAASGDEETQGAVGTLSRLLAEIQNVL